MADGTAISLAGGNISPLDYNDRLASSLSANAISTVSSYPTSVFLNITDGCNQRCRFCFGNHKKASEATFANLETIAAMKWLGWAKVIMIIGSGEALFHPQYAKILYTIRKLAPGASIRVYTNGLGLTGKRLTATLDCADKVIISMNAVSKQAYEAVILNGSHAQIMENIKNLEARRPAHMEVNLGLVVVKETVDEIKKMVDLASACRFQTVFARRGKSPGDPSPEALPESSYFAENDEGYFDYNALRQYAAEKNVLLCSPTDEWDFLYKAHCDAPWKELRLNACPGGWELKFCCEGQLNVFIKEQDAIDIAKIWNSKRIQFVRETVNGENIMANRMCLLCRYEHSADPKFQAAGQLIKNRLGLKSGMDSFPPEWLE